MVIPIKQINCKNLNLLGIKEALFDFVNDKTDLPFIELNRREGTVVWSKFKSSFYPVSNRPNIYIIYHREFQKVNWKPLYVGQRKSTGILQRLNNHFNKCSIGTGSKRDKLKEIIKRGDEISIKVIRVEPETLRGYFEQELIKEFKEELSWNIQT